MKQRSCRSIRMGATFLVSALFLVLAGCGDQERQEMLKKIASLEVQLRKARLQLEESQGQISRAHSELLSIKKKMEKDIEVLKKAQKHYSDKVTQLQIQMGRLKNSLKDGGEAVSETPDNTSPQVEINEDDEPELVIPKK